MAGRLSPVPDEPPRVCLYARVSMVGTREEIISPDVQMAAGRERAVADDWRVSEEIVELDQTGRTFARKGIRKAIEGVEDGKWDIVAVYRYDRFGRNARDSLVNIARVEKAGGRVVSLTEPFDPETAIGRYGRTNLLAVAELQSDIIGENWKATHARRKAQGLPHGGARRFGYRKDGKRFVPDEEWAPILAECYRRFVAGAGLRTLAEWLNELGAPTRTKTARRWSHNGVRSMLDSGFGAGLLHFTDGTYLQGAHEPVIDTKTWQQYQAARRARASTPRRLISPITPLSGVVWCAHCRRRMRSKSEARYGRAYLFLCEYPDCEQHPTVLRKNVEAEVLGFLATLADEVTVRAEAKAQAVQHRAVAREERRALAREVTRIDQALVRLAKNRATGDMPEGVYRQARDELLQERAASEARLEQLGPETQVAPPSRTVVRGLLKDWDVLPVARRRDMLDAILRVEVTRRPSEPAGIAVVPRWTVN